MRKITAGMFISLDGVVEDPQNWHFPYFNDEMGAAVDSQLAAADTLLLGRKTYDSFAGAWPDREAAGEEDAAMGKALGDARKIVVSNQNLQFTWRNSEQLKGDLVEAVTALKNEPGATDIAMSGSVSVVRQCSPQVSSTSCICSSTRSSYARACDSSTRANPHSRYGWSHPRHSPPALCTSSTARPNRLPSGPMRTRKHTCPKLRTADSPPLGWRIGDSRREEGTDLNLLICPTRHRCPSAHRSELGVDRGRAGSELGEKGPL
jgi:dihydrofolate reductase